MIIHTNKTATLRRLESSGQKRVMSTTTTTVRVYFNSLQEEAVGGIDGRADFKVARVMTNPGAAFAIGDELTIDGKKWKVDNYEAHSDLTGGHETYLVSLSQ